MRPDLNLLVDMDGVLADFHTAALEFYGRMDLHGKGGVNDLAFALGMTQAEFIRGLPKNFFAELQAAEYFHEIVRIVNDFDPNWHICSTPGTSRHAPESKMAWIERHLPAFCFERVIFISDKSRLREPGVVLIDDFAKQVDKFRAVGKRRAPGDAFLLPAWWNRNRGEGFYLRNFLWAAQYCRRDPEDFTEQGHLLYRTGEHDCPNRICDQHGEVVLGMCRICRRAESELEEPCPFPLQPDPH